MATTFSSNGYLMLGPLGGALEPMRTATEIDSTTDANSAVVITLVGDVGATFGIKMGRISVRGAVARGSVEALRVAGFLFDNAFLECRHRAGGMETRIVGTVQNSKKTDRVNQPTEFDFEISGQVFKPVRV